MEESPQQDPTAPPTRVAPRGTSPVFLENFKSTRDLANDAFKTFDKSIISLAAGALFLTITFVEKLAPAPVAVILLKSSWGFFAAALLCIVASQATSARSLTCQAENLIADEFGKTCRDNKWARPTELLNWSAMAAFALGVTLFALFGTVNLTEQRQREVKAMSDKNWREGSLPKNVTIPRDDFPREKHGVPSNTIIPKDPQPQQPQAPPPSKDKK